MNYTKGEWKSDQFRQVVSESKVICFIGLRGHIEDDEDASNANLIAAAPDMYEALKAINAAKDPFNDVTIIRNMVNALRKAEGR